MQWLFDCQHHPYPQKQVSTWYDLAWVLYPLLGVPTNCTVGAEGMVAFETAYEVRQFPYRLLRADNLDLAFPNSERRDALFRALGFTGTPEEFYREYLCNYWARYRLTYMVSEAVRP